MFYVRDESMLGPMNTVAVRPVTPEDITDEMVERALVAFGGSDLVKSEWAAGNRAAMRAAIAAAVTNPEGRERSS